MTLTPKLPYIVHRILFTFLTIGLVATAAWAAAPSGQAPLDNDPNDEREQYEGVSRLDRGEIDTRDGDDDGDFDSLAFGMSRGAELFGWDQLDEDADEGELVVADPSLETDAMQRADADDDGDPEVLWVGTRGADFDGDGEITLAEAGSVIGFPDLDGDGHKEIAVEDTSRELGTFHKDAFDVHADRRDGFSVLWIGVLRKGQQGRAASVLGVTDVDGDGEPEVELRDIRTSSPLRFDQFIDVDGDGDGDIVIRLPES